MKKLLETLKHDSNKEEMKAFLASLGVKEEGKEGIEAINKFFNDLETRAGQYESMSVQEAAEFSNDMNKVMSALVQICGEEILDELVPDEDDDDDFDDEDDYEDDEDFDDDDFDDEEDYDDDEDFEDDIEEDEEEEEHQACAHGCRH